jgi:hypothetical protein
MDYGVHILNKLLDAYERSSHYRGDAVINRRIAFRFTKTALPHYFDDTTARYKNDINDACCSMEQAGLISIQWMKHEEGNIIDRVYLNLERVDEAYRAARRRPRASKQSVALELVRRYGADASDWLKCFYDFLLQRLNDNKSPIYIDIDDLDEAENIFKALNAMNGLEDETPRRVFSVHVLGHSKAFEEIEAKVGRILLDFCPAVKGLDKKEALAEMGVVDNPQHIYVSGPLTLTTGGAILDISRCYPDIGLPSDMIKSLTIADIGASYVMTIENLTTYYQYIKSHRDGVVLYLGGYHNRLRRRFLTALYLYIKQHGLDIPFYHWGDIDYGGFAILSHLRRRCGIDFKPYRMDVETLQAFCDKATAIDDAYKKRLTALLADPFCQDCGPAIRYMIERGIRLEQEAIGTG